MESAHFTPGTSHPLKRRIFIKLVAGGLFAAPLAGEAQPAGNVYRIGYLTGGLSTDSPGLREAFRQGLRELGWVEGQNMGNNLAPAFVVATRQRADAIFAPWIPSNYVHRRLIIEFAAKSRLPASYGVRDFVEDDSLMSYGPDVLDIFRRGATYVDKILKGAKPSNLPVEQPTKFELVINLKTAKALGLTIPQSLLLRADEVIQ